MLIVLDLLKKVALGVATVWIASVVIFATVELLPQDPAVAALGPYSTVAQRDAFRERMHLNDPAVDRYLKWLGGMVRGDFGSSMVSGNPIGPQLALRVKFSIILALVSLVAGTVLALPVAMFAARHATRPGDVTASSIALGISALPEYVVGIVLMYFLAVALPVFPVVSNGVLNGDLDAYFLPAVTLGLVVGAYVFRLARVSIGESLSATYVRTAVLNGYSPRRILWRHVLPNAGVVVINVIAQNALYLLGGIIVVENVFAYPGLGTLLVQAIGSKDFTLIEGAAVVLSLLFVAINFVADAVVLWMTPRSRAAG